MNTATFSIAGSARNTELHESTDLEIFFDTCGCKFNVKLSSAEEQLSKQLSAANGWAKDWWV